MARYYVGMYAILAILCWALVFGGLGRWIAIQCGRSPAEGFVVCFLFGPFGVIIELLLPKYTKRPSDDWKAKGWSGPLGS